MTARARLLLRSTSLLMLAQVAACGDDGGVRLDSDDAGSSGSATTVADTTSGTTAPMIECMPGDLRCSNDATALERCAPTGRMWIPEACPSATVCQPCEDDTCSAPSCVGPCDSVDDLPSSAGCSFIANRQLHLDEEAPDGLIVANPNTTVSATIQIYTTPEGSNVEEAVGDPVVLEPLESHAYQLDTTFVMGYSSMFRTGGTWRVQSDVPIIAYHHAPFQIAIGNDSSMLLPESSLRNDYVVMSYSPHDRGFGLGEPSYFEVVALADFTTVEWFPRVDTAGNGLPIPFVEANGMGSLKMNRFDTMRVAASGNLVEVVEDRDVSGTVIRADKPIWVTTGVRCARVPVRDAVMYPIGFCDPMQEMALPLEYWGTTYVGAPAPDRGDEEQHWRVYAGADDVTITTDPEVVPPIVLAERGEWFEFKVPNQTAFMFESDRAFMPVQYLQSRRYSIDPAGEGLPEPDTDATDVGDPAMYQMVPVEQFLDRYVVATAVGFELNYAQVIRRVGADEVYLNGDPVPFDYQVGDYEVANYPVDAGTYEIESGDPFGIVQIGYSIGGMKNPLCLSSDPMPECFSSYAFIGGIKAEQIFIP